MFAAASKKQMVSMIDTEYVFRQLKKQNGEHVAKIIREAVLLDVQNIAHLLEFAGNDSTSIRKLIPYIRENYTSKPTLENRTDKNPLTLLKSVHYKAFVVKTLKQQNSISKYFRKGEELCTFNDPNRYKNYHMIHAIKENADKIKPASNPQREDDYGTSVISIQILKTGGVISIKNRYNHTVEFPDATFYNNPDNIVKGLTYSLQKYFNVDFYSYTENPLPDNYILVGDQLVKYNYEFDNIYFGHNCYVKDGGVVKLDANHQIMLDHMILDTKTKKITSICNSYLYGKMGGDVFANEFNGKSISIEIDKNDRNKKIISTSDGNRVVVKNGAITECLLPDVENVDDHFLLFNKTLTSLNLPNVKKIGNDFLDSNTILTTLNLPNVKDVGSCFLYSNASLISLNLPNIKKIGACFLFENERLISLSIPNIEEIKECFLECNNVLKTLIISNKKRFNIDNRHIKILLAHDKMNKTKKIINNHQIKQKVR